MAVVEAATVISRGAKRRIVAQYGGCPWISVHAVERFRERLAPGLTIAQARGRLLWLSRERMIQPTRQRLPDGCRIYTSPAEPNAKFVVREDHDGWLEVVTVLHVNDDPEPEIDGVDPDELRIAMAAQRGRKR